MSLQPGCVIERKTEREIRYPENEPVQHWKRECSRVTSCDDPSYNTEWTCRPWERES